MCEGEHMSKGRSLLYAAAAVTPFLKSRRGRAETRLERMAGSECSRA